MNYIDILVWVISPVAVCAVVWWKVFRGDARDHRPPSDALERVIPDTSDALERSDLLWSAVGQFMAEDWKLGSNVLHAALASGTPATRATQFSCAWSGPAGALTAQPKGAHVRASQSATGRAGTSLTSPRLPTNAISIPANAHLGANRSARRRVLSVKGTTAI